MKKIFSLFFFLVLQSILYSSVIVVPDYAPYADTLFPSGSVIDYNAAPFWWKIKYLLNQQNYVVYSVNENNLPKKLGKKDILLPWSDALNLTQMKSYSSDNLILLLFQPDTVAPTCYTTSFLNKFSKVITWNDDWVDGSKYYKFHYGVCYPMISDTVDFSRRKFCCAMASNKTSTGANQLYSTRKSFFTYFNQYHPTEFDLYGLYWEGEGLSVYKGWATDKVQTLKNYKYSICFENTKGAKGYITEKIFDCFQAGVVPVYYGASNISDEVSSDCFIDWRNFSSYDELYRYLSNITETEFNQYLSNMRRYLATDQAAKYSPSNGAKEIVSVLTDTDVLSLSVVITL